MHDFGSARKLGGEVVERFVDREELGIVGAFECDEHVRFERVSRAPAATFLREPTPRLVDDDVSHRARCRAEEVAATLVVHTGCVPAEQPHPRLVHEGRGLQCLAVVATEASLRHAPQFGVDDLDELFGRARVPVLAASSKRVTMPFGGSCLESSGTLQFPIFESVMFDRE